MNVLLNKIIEPKNQIREEQKIFSNRTLKVMLIPLFMEQLLGVLVGVADTFMVSYAGEAAVSGVSLVNMFNTVFLFLFSALAAGGSVVVSQYIGSREKEKSSLSAGQLVNTKPRYYSGRETRLISCADTYRKKCMDRSKCHGSSRSDHRR